MEGYRAPPRAVPRSRTRQPPGRLGTGRLVPNPGTRPFRRYLTDFPDCENACCWAYSVKAGKWELKYLTPLCHHWDLRLPTAS